jgi:hypothetical protein
MPDQAFEASHVAAVNGDDTIGSSQRREFGRDNRVRFVAASFGRIENEVSVESDFILASESDREDQARRSQQHKQIN